MTLRVGFLGAGLIAQYHGKMLHGSGRDVAFAAVHDPDPGRAAAFGERSGAEVVATEDEVLRRSDAVYVCTWTSEHRRLVEKAAAAGKAVFCEKPLSTNLADALDMVEAVQQAGVVNQVGLVLRDSPAFLLLRHLIDRPESGRVMSIVFRDDQYLPVQGMYGSTWRGDVTKAGAGTLLEHSIHDLDLLEVLCGPVASVSARTAGFHGLPGIEDVATVGLGFASGATGTLTSVWHDVLARPSLRRVEVFCERAFYVLEGDVDGPVRWTLDGDDGSLAGAELLARLDELGIALRNPDGAFVDAVVAGTPAHPDFAAALRPHLLVEAVYRSAAEGAGEGIAAGGVAVAVPSGVPGIDWV